MRRLRQDEGFTILELSIAIAVFMVVLGTAAQALVSFYVAVDMQHQREEAVQLCAAVLSDLRVVRDANPGSFPDAIVEVFPDDAILNPGEEVQLDEGHTVIPNQGTLRNQLVQIDYADDTANPLQVEVSVTWDNLRGQPMQVSLSTALTDR